MNHLDRIESILKQASDLPKIEPPPPNPTHRELLDGYVRLAYAYAASTALLQQTVPLIVEELRAVHSELGRRKRRSAKKAAR